MNRIQRVMTTVCHTRKRAVPRKLAIDSLNRPNVSESYDTPTRPAARGVVGLLLLFTPLHAIDLLRDRPVAVNKPGALVRLLLQVWLIHQAQKMAGDG